MMLACGIVAGGQIALMVTAILLACVVGVLVTYLCDHVHCEHCHHVETEEPLCRTKRTG